MAEVVTILLVISVHVFNVSVFIFNMELAKLRQSHHIYETVKDVIGKTYSESVPMLGRLHRKFHSSVILSLDFPVVPVQQKSL